jgi:hypothetical protein
MLLLQMVYLNLASLSLETFAFLGWKNQFYAKRPSIRKETGFDTTIQIGGINENATEDNISPKVKLYMNDDFLFLAHNKSHPHFCWLSSG